MLSNVTLIDGTQIAATEPFVTIERFGYKIGIMSISEFDWITTLNCFDVEDIRFRDIVKDTERWARVLREEEGCDFVIALTHMRVPNDIKLANESAGVDIFLGGHDHVEFFTLFSNLLKHLKIYAHQKIKENFIVKSGCDYRNFSHIVIEKGTLTADEQNDSPKEPINDKNVETGKEYLYQIKEGKFKLKIQKYDVTKDVEPNALIKSKVDNYYLELDKEMHIVNCHLDETVDTAFSSVRTEENPIGNFICDLMKKEHSADIAFLNSGNIRADKVYEKGFMKVGDWYDIVPFTVPIVKIECTGLMIKNACEVSVSKYPALEGRFLQTSNLFFKFDPSKEPGERVKIEDVRIGDKQIDPEDTYTVATCNYVANGKDGYDCLIGSGIIVEEENAPLLKQIILQFFGKPIIPTLTFPIEIILIYLN